MVGEKRKNAKKVKQQQYAKGKPENDEDKIIGIDERKETKKERKLRERLEKEKAALDVEQLQINLNGKDIGKSSKLFDVEKEIKDDKKVRTEKS